MCFSRCWPRRNNGQILLVNHLGSQPSFLDDVLDAAAGAVAVRSDGVVVDSVALADRMLALGEGNNSILSEIVVTGKPQRGLRWSTWMLASLVAIY